MGVKSGVELCPDAQWQHRPVNSRATVRIFVSTAGVMAGNSSEFSPRLAATIPDENGRGIWYRPPRVWALEVGFRLVSQRPVTEFDRGVARHHRLSLPAGKHAP